LFAGLFAPFICSIAAHLLSQESSIVRSSFQNFPGLTLPDSRGGTGKEKQQT